MPQSRRTNALKPQTPREMHHSSQGSSAAQIEPGASQSPRPSRQMTSSQHRAMDIRSSKKHYPSDTLGETSFPKRPRKTQEQRSLHSQDSRLPTHIAQTSEGMDSEGDDDESGSDAAYAEDCNDSGGSGEILEDDASDLTDVDPEGEDDIDEAATARVKSYEKLAREMVNQTILDGNTALTTINPQAQGGPTEANVHSLERNERLPQSRSIRVIRQDLQPVVEEAAKVIIERTLFECPFPAVSVICDWVADAWADALKAAGKAYEKCNDVCMRELRSRHWRIRSQLVYGCKQDIEYLYQIDQKDPLEVKHRVEWLLHQDRFNCRNREDITLRFLAPEIPEFIFRRYFRGSRMRGRIDHDFLPHFNKQFVCFTATVIQHCLKSWSSGVYNEQGRFRGPTPKAVWLRQLSTWDNLNAPIQENLLEAIRRAVDAEAGHQKLEGVIGFLDDERLLQQQLQQILTGSHTNPEAPQARAETTEIREDNSAPNIARLPSLHDEQ